MLIQTRSILVEKGYARQVAERFGGPSPVDEMPGLIDRTVSINKRSKDEEEVLVLIRWESEEAWKNWEKSPQHIQGHREGRSKPKPAYILGTTVNLYEVETVQTGRNSEANN